MSDTVHTYRTTLSWEGTTAGGYRHYDRGHRVATPPATDPLVLTADPAFLGDAALTNPEQLLVAAASSCQLLSFLAVAAGARLVVVAYEDEATAVMPEDDPPMRITRIELHPTITLADGERPRPDPARLLHLTEVAHRQCFIANSLLSEIVVSPTFTWTAAA
ncbi:OsmC family protein [soil metagenome]